MSTNSGLIYKITDKTNGKIYIGQTHDLKDRIRHYRYDATHFDRLEEYRSERPIDVVMHEHGFENFEFSVLQDNIEENALNAAETAWIYFLHANDPDVGYNMDFGGFGKPTKEQSMARHGDAYKSKPLSPAAKLSRSLGIVTYDPDENKMEFRVSAKVLSDELGNTRSEVTKANNRGSRLGGKYIFYIDDERRYNTYMLISARKRATGNTQALMSLAAYEDAYNIVDKAVKVLNAQGRLKFSEKDIIDHEKKFSSNPVKNDHCTCVETN